MQKKYIHKSSPEHGKRILDQDPAHSGRKELFHPLPLALELVMFSPPMIRLYVSQWDKRVKAVASIMAKGGASSSIGTFTIRASRGLSLECANRAEGDSDGD